MNLKALPPELIWNVLDNLTNLQDRKRASLVCKKWNRMVFNSKSLRDVSLRICTKVSSLEQLETEELIERMFDVMTRSKRNYANIEFFHVNFERSAVRELLFFVVQLCCDSIECLRFTNCHGLRRSELWQILELLPRLRELIVSGGIYYDNLGNDVGVCKLNRLESLTLDIGDDCRLYNDFASNASNVECLNIRTINGCVDLRDVAATRRFSQQLKALSFSTNRYYNQAEFSEMSLSQLTKLELKVSGYVWPDLFKQLKLLKELKLEASINDEVIAAICSTSSKLKRLNLLSSGLVECKKFNMMARLEDLEELQIRGIYKYSWRHVSFSKLSRLYLDNVGTDFTNFLKDLTSLRSLEIHDTKLKNEQLIKITLNSRTVERLELAFCSKISDKGFKHLMDMTSLRELRLWGIQVSKNIDERFVCPRLQNIIFYFNDFIEDCTLNALALRLPQLKQLVLYDCYRISPQGVTELRKTLSSCKVLELYRGDELPPELVAETQIYYRNAEFPNGVLSN